MLKKELNFYFYTLKYRVKAYIESIHEVALNHPYHNFVYVTSVCKCVVLSSIMVMYINANTL